MEKNTAKEKQNQTQQTAKPQANAQQKGQAQQQNTQQTQKTAEKTTQSQTKTITIKPETAGTVFSKGDTLVASVKVYVDGILMEKPGLVNKKIVLGNSDFLPGFDETLLGQTYSKSFTIECKAIKKNPYAPFNNKKVKYEVKIHDFVSNETNSLREENKKMKEELKKLEEEIKKVSAAYFKQKNEIADMNANYKAKVLSIQEKANEELKEEKLHNASLLEQHKAEIKQYALQKFMEDFLMPYANLRMAIFAGRKSDNPVVKNFIVGFNMILNQMENVFTDYDIKIVDPTIGSEFDATTQQILEQVIDNDSPENTIKQVHSIGFTLHNRLIKPALIVASKKDKKENSKVEETPKVEEKTMDKKSSDDVAKEEPTTQQENKIEDEPIQETEKLEVVEDEKEIKEPGKKLSFWQKRQLKKEEKRRQQEVEKAKDITDEQEKTDVNEFVLDDSKE